MDVYHNSVRIPKKLIHEDVSFKEIKQAIDKDIIKYTVYIVSDFVSPDVERVSSLNILNIMLRVSGTVFIACS